MNIVSTSLVALALSISVVALASPSQARTHQTREHQTRESNSTDNMNSARAAAVHECSLQADKAYPAAGYGSANSAKYRACLSEHGQQE